MDAIFQTTFSNGFSWMKMHEFRLKLTLKFLPKELINNIPALVQIMAWHRPGDKPLSEPIMVSLPRHICVTRPQWINRSQFDFGNDKRASFQYARDKSSKLTYFQSIWLAMYLCSQFGSQWGSGVHCMWLKESSPNLPPKDPHTTSRAPSQYKDRLIYVWRFPC